MRCSSFLAATLTAAASGAPARAETVPGGTHFVERRADFDRTAFDRAARRGAIRQLWEAVAFKPAVFDNVKNALNGLQFGFGYAPDEIALAFCGHGPSASYGFSDEIWRKYRIGEFRKVLDASGAPATANAWYPEHSAYDTRANPDDVHGMYQDTSLQMLQRRRVAVFTCHTVVEERARALVKGDFAPHGMTPSQVADDILEHLIPGAVIVPSMVATIAVLQAQFRYTYVTLAS